MKNKYCLEKTSRFLKSVYKNSFGIGISLMMVLVMPAEVKAIDPEINHQFVEDSISPQEDLSGIVLSSPSELELYPIPPMPDVWIDGRWVTWEEAYGPIQIYRTVSFSNQNMAQPRSQTSSASSQLSNYAQIMASLTLEDCDQNKINILKRRAALNLSSPLVPKESILELQTNSLQSLTNNVIPASTEDGTNSIKLHFVGFTYDEAKGNCGYALLAEGIHPNQVIEVYHTPDMASGQWYGIDVIERTDFANNISGIIVSTEGLGFLSQNFFCAFVLQDTDQDGISDGMEKMIFKSDPNNPDSAILRDQNGDGAPDYADVANNWICDGDEDLDNDGWTNAEELAMGTNPFVKDDNEIDSDNDGLPDWAENLIKIYCGVENPTPFEDSDGDGVNNYTELLLGTDPSAKSYPYYVCDFGQNNHFVMPDILLQSTGTNSTLTNGLCYESFGLIGTYTHVSLKRNYFTNGVYYDRIKVAGSSENIDFNIPAIETNTPVNTLRYGLVSTSELLGGAISILDEVWHEPGVSANLESLDQSSILLILNRSMGRIPVIMKRLQTLSVPLVQEDNFQDLPVGMQQRTCKLVSNLLSEISLYERYVTRYAYFEGGIPYLRFINNAMGVCRAFTLVGSVLDMNKLQAIEDQLPNYFSQLSEESGSGQLGGVAMALAGAITNYLQGIQPIYPTWYFTILNELLCSPGGE